MTHWRAPFTGGQNAILPAGTIVVARDDQRPDAPGFNCVPEDYARLETVLVPARRISAQLLALQRYRIDRRAGARRLVLCSVGEWPESIGLAALNFTTRRAKGRSPGCATSSMRERT